MVAQAALSSDALCHGQHACGIVGSATQQLQMISGFVRSGLDAGDQVWCFPHGDRSEVLDRLRHDGLDVDHALAIGQLLVQPSHESGLTALAWEPDAVIDNLRRSIEEATAVGWSGFRIVGDVGWAVRGRSCPQRLLDFEAQLGELLARSPATALCQYDQYRFDSAIMLALTRVHPIVVGSVTIPAADELVISPLAGEAGLRLAGDVDLSTREALRTALEHALPRSGDLHLELSDLAFIDLDGAQLVLRMADRLGPGRRMVVHRPPRSLRLALSQLWETPNLVEAEPN